MNIPQAASFANVALALVVIVAITCRWFPPSWVIITTGAIVWILVFGTIAWVNIREEKE